MEHESTRHLTDYRLQCVCSAADLPFEFWHLFSFWEPEQRTAVPRKLLREPLNSFVAEERLEYLDLYIREGPPPWRIGFTSQFRKDVGELDRKLQGRILEALQEVSGYAPPFRAKGDTFKPLKGDLLGYWRYRIGDFRLVIKPIVAESEIDVITFSARGAVYD